MSTQISKEDIRAAAIMVGESIAAFDTSDRPLHVFTEKHESIMRRILSIGAGRKRGRPFAKRLIACIIALLILFAGAYAFIPSVHAAVSEWFITVWNNTVEFIFPHSGNDHAFPVITPTSIPDRYKLSSDKSGDGYRTLKYSDNSNGDYITFDYRWISEKQAERLEQDIEKNGSVIVFTGNNALLKNDKKKTSLKWYEPHHMIGFSVESNLQANELIAVLTEMDWHLPEFEPTWIPDGFILVDKYYDPGRTIQIFIESTSGDVLVLDYMDYESVDQFAGSLTDADITEEIVINGSKAFLAYTDESSPDYDPSNIYNGLTIFWVDNDNHILFSVDSSISRDESIRFLESVRPK